MQQGIRSYVYVGDDPVTGPTRVGWHPASILCVQFRTTMQRIRASAIGQGETTAIRVVRLKLAIGGLVAIVSLVALGSVRGPQPGALPVAVDSAAVDAEAVALQTSAIVKAETVGQRLGKSVEGQVFKPLKAQVEDVLKGEQGLSSLTQEQRAIAARYYRYVAEHVTGKFPVEARLYNLERARYLEQGGPKVPPSLPAFIRTLHH